MLAAGLLLFSSPSAASAVSSLDDALTVVDSLRAHRQFHAALHRLDSLEQVHPKSVAVQWRRALLYADLGKAAPGTEAVALYKQALEAANTALRIDSSSARAHMVKALAEGRLTLHVGTAERLKRSRRVKQHADRAIALDSTLAPAYHLRGRWHRNVADLNFLQRTLAKSLYGGLPDASFEQAILDFKRAIELESKPYNHLELAKTYLAVGHKKTARTQLQNALERSGSPFDREYKREARSLLADLR